jgi:DNA-binding CsgD family transcriptional regulator
MNRKQSPEGGGGDQASPVEELTRREWEICRLIGLGYTNLDIAASLGIGQKTVETHRKNAMGKLGLRNRAELVRFILSHGLGDPFPIGSVFRHCPTCLTKWSFRGAFLSDPEVEFLGYHPLSGGNPAGVMLFKHMGCGTNLPCPLEWFQPLTNLPMLGGSCSAGAGGDHCLGQGQDPSTPCPLRCVCAFVWHVTQVIRGWPRQKASGIQHAAAIALLNWADCLRLGFL